jgi:MYXO-CTERM domain-containing protein
VVTVTNTGTADLFIGQVAAANPLEAPFSVSSDTCSGRSLAPAATCSLVIRFVPGAPRGFNDSFNIPSNDPDETSIIVTVTGTGTVATGGGSSAADPALVLLLAALAGAARRRRG